MKESLAKLDKECKMCRNIFTALDSRTVYCSVKCRNLFNNNKRNTVHMKICLECGSEFIAKGNAKRCSPECTKKHRKTFNSKEYKALHTNFEHKRLQSKLYYQKNKQQILSQVKSYHFNKLTIDPSYKIGCELRSKLLKIVRKQLDSNVINSIAGCTLSKLLNHLQETAVKNNLQEFNIHNYDSKQYHIDHIKPCSEFDFTNSEDAKECFHYSNLQILTAEDNMKKHNKTIGYE